MLPGLREIEDRDAQQVGDLLRAYLARFDMSPVMSDEEVLHNFYSGKGTGPVDPVTGWRKGQVTWTYVVEVSIPSLNAGTAECSVRIPTRTASPTSSRSTPYRRRRYAAIRNRRSMPPTSFTWHLQPVPTAALCCPPQARKVHLLRPVGIRRPAKIERS